jgi:hypothetical protein
LPEEQFIRVRFGELLGASTLSHAALQLNYICHNTVSRKNVVKFEQAISHKLVGQTQRPTSASTHDPAICLQIRPM